MNITLIVRAKKIYANKLIRLKMLCNCMVTVGYNSYYANSKLVMLSHLYVHERFLLREE